MSTDLTPPSEDEAILAGFPVDGTWLEQTNWTVDTAADAIRTMIERERSPVDDALLQHVAGMNLANWTPNHLAWLFAAATLRAAVPGSTDHAGTIRAVALTLRQISRWGDMPAGHFADLAVQVENLEPGWTCPMCQEATCDGGCPLEHVRAQLADTVRTQSGGDSQ